MSLEIAEGSMLVLGLTGSIAMGKSTAAAAFRAHDVEVFDADAAVHRLLAPGGEAVSDVAREFPDAVDSRGGIDRKALGAWIFTDESALGRLEAVLHPQVRSEERRFLARAAIRHLPLVVLDIPLLFETGAERRVDAVIVVSAPAFLQEARVLGRPAFDRERLAAIRARQMPDAVKRKRADYIVNTGLSRRHSLDAIARILDDVRGRTGHAWPGRRPPRTTTSH